MNDLNSQETLDAVRVQLIDNAIVKPSGYTLVPVENFLETPVRAQGLIKAESIDSLLGYVCRYAGSCNPVIFVDRGSMYIEAVLDWHEHRENGLGRWGEHCVAMSLAHTQEFQAWLGIAGKPVNQKQFAEFIEENLEAVFGPPAADILTVITTIEGKRNVDFKSGVRLSNGDVQLRYEERTDAKGHGDIEVPSELTLRLPVFTGAERETTYDFRALLRYRLNDGRLSFELKILGVDRIIDLAIRDIIEGIEEKLKKAKLTSIPVYRGKLVSSPRETLNASMTR